MASQDVNSFRLDNGLEPRTFDSIRMKLSRMYATKQDKLGVPVLPGPFNTTAARSSVSETLAKARHELALLSKKRKYSEEYYKIEKKKGNMPRRERPRNRDV